MAKRVLVPVDGSPLSEKAFERALADDVEAVVALHVIDPSDPGYSAPVDVDVTTEPLHGSPEWYERAEAIAEDLLEDLLDTAADAGVDVTTVTVTGDPARSVVQYAEEHAIDEIYVGSHGRLGDTNLVLGQVAELIVARAPVTVTVVR